MEFNLFRESRSATKPSTLWEPGLEVLRHLCENDGNIFVALRGTLFIYHGQELGVTHPRDWTIEDYQDVETKRRYQK